MQFQPDCLMFQSMMPGQVNITKMTKTHTKKKNDKTKCCRKENTAADHINLRGRT